MAYAVPHITNNIVWTQQLQCQCQCHTQHTACHPTVDGAPGSVCWFPISIDGCMQPSQRTTPTALFTTSCSPLPAGMLPYSPAGESFPAEQSSRPGFGAGPSSLAHIEYILYGCESWETLPPASRLTTAYQSLNRGDSTPGGLGRRCVFAAGGNGIGWAVGGLHNPHLTANQARRCVALFLSFAAWLPCGRAPMCVCFADHDGVLTGKPRVRLEREGSVLPAPRCILRLRHGRGRASSHRALGVGFFEFLWLNPYHTSAEMFITLQPLFRRRGLSTTCWPNSSQHTGASDTGHAVSCACLHHGERQPPTPDKQPRTSDEFIQIFSIFQFFLKQFVFGIPPIMLLLGHSILVGILHSAASRLCS